MNPRFPARPLASISRTALGLQVRGIVSMCVEGMRPQGDLVDRFGYEAFDAALDRGYICSAMTWDRSVYARAPYVATEAGVAWAEEGW